MKRTKADGNIRSLFTMDFIIVLILTFLNSTIYQSFTTAIPVYSKSIGGNNVDAGLLVAVYMIAAIAIRPFWGYLADTKSRYMVVILGASLVVVSLVGYNFAATIPALLVLRFIQGLGFSGNTNTTSTMAADIIPDERMSEGIGYYGLSNVLATAIGPTLAVTLMDDFGFRSFFMICTVAGFVCVFLASMVRYEKKLPKDRKKSMEKPKIRLYEKSAVPASLVMLFVSFCSGSIASFVSLLSIARGIENYKMYFMVYAVSLMITRLFTGKISDRKGPQAVILPALASIAAAFVLFACAHTLPMLLLAGVFFGFGYGVAQPMLNAMVMLSCDKSNRGAANSTFYICMDLGGALGAAIAGVISERMGYTVLYGFCEIYVVCALVIFGLQVKNRKKNVLRKA
ncbi:MAG: MFS transporter [Ruminococcus sp.]